MVRACPASRRCRLGGRLREAATIGGAARLGEAVGPEALGRIDLVVAGSVAVNRRGARVGKGGGYSDLEFALARAVERSMNGPRCSRRCTACRY